MGHREPLVARLYADFGMQSSATCPPSRAAQSWAPSRGLRARPPSSTKLARS